MASFICQTCGATLNAPEGVYVVECDHCFVNQAVPKVINENLQNLYDRAVNLRIKCDFDKAEKIYEKIIQSDPDQAEAYWGLILCKYGIEYVKDPATQKNIPTCHRASYDSIVSDLDYKSVLENSNTLQRVVYEEQAKEIDRIQKDILALAQKEESYDVFICYKETGENGQRTQDSVIANDIYYQLTSEGFKVFYAAISLESKVGQDYEPIIFAALNSAKVMLAIGTKPEYFNAVWVKNEWSRYLKIIQKDRSKHLFPCYRDMDPYDLPEDFAHLQAQDMGKIGFINDLVRGIKKVLEKNEPKTVNVIKETVTVGADFAPLLKRVFIFLKDGDFEAADEYCEKVLDQDPENAQAYVGKLCVEFKFHEISDFARYDGDPKRVLASKNFVKISNYNSSLANEINGLYEQNLEWKKESTYNDAIVLKTNAKTVEDFQNAINIFSSIKDYRDSNAQIDECKEGINAVNYKSAMQIKNLARGNISKLEKAMLKFLDLGDYKDAAAQAEECCEMRKESIYSAGVAQMNNAADAEGYIKAQEIFEEIKGYKDADALATECYVLAREFIYSSTIYALKHTNDVADYNTAIQILSTMKDYKDAEKIISKCESFIREIEQKKKAVETAKRKLTSIQAELGKHTTNNSVDGCFFDILITGYFKFLGIMLVLSLLVGGIILLVSSITDYSIENLIAGIIMLTISSIVITIFGVKKIKKIKARLSLKHEEKTLTAQIEKLNKEIADMMANGIKI